MKDPERPAKASQNAGEGYSQPKNIKFDVHNILEKLDPGYRHAYEDHSEIENYRSLMYFHNLTKSEILIKITEEAFKTDLTNDHVQDFLTGSDIWQYLSRDQKQVVAGHFQIDQKADTDAEKLQKSIASEESERDIEYWFDDENGIRFSGGNLYRLKKGEKEEHKRLLLSAPLTIDRVVKTDHGTEIDYTFAGIERRATIKDLVSQVSVDMRSTRDANKSLSELLYKYEQENISKGNFDIQHDPIFIDEEDLIRVGYDSTGIDVKDTLALLRDFYPRSANPHAFLSALGFNLIAPLAYHIRIRAPVGYLFPIRVSYGHTEGGKTSMDSIFVLKGYDQDKDAGLLTDEQVATPFTFEKNMGDSTLPVIINDVEADWLSRVSTVLKNSSENPTAGDRGNPDQTITRRRMKRALNITSNEVVSPSDDAAKNRRYILEEYTEEHVKRRNPAAFQKFIDALPDGFMFALFQEVFDGVLIDNIIKDLLRTEDTCGFVNFSINLINRICAKYRIEPFPAYKANLNDGPDSFTELAEWLQSQWYRLRNVDENGKPLAPYPDIDRSEIDVDETDSATIFWFTGAAYKIAQKKLNLPHKTVTALFSNYVENRRIQIFAINRSHRFQHFAGRGFALKIIDEEALS